MLFLSSSPDPVSSAQDRKGKPDFLSLGVCNHLHVFAIIASGVTADTVFSVCENSLPLCGHIRAYFQSQHVSEIPVKHSCYFPMLVTLLQWWQCW